MNGVLSTVTEPRSYKEDNCGNQVNSVRESEEKSQWPLVKGQLKVMLWSQDFVCAVGTVIFGVCETVVITCVYKDAHKRTSPAREFGSASLTREPGSDVFHHTRMSGLRTLLVHFSIQNEFIAASCSSGDITTIPNSAQFFPKW
jgi:hypothetical protein